GAIDRILGGHSFRWCPGLWWIPSTRQFARLCAFPVLPAAASVASGWRHPAYWSDPSHVASAWGLQPAAPVHSYRTMPGSTTSATTATGCAATRIRPYAWLSLLYSNAYPLNLPVVLLVLAN